MDKNKQLTEQLIKATNEVRQKCNSLKRNKYDDELLLEESYKPITKPLNQLVEKFQVKPEEASTSTSSPSSSSSFQPSPKRLKKEDSESSSEYDSAEEEYHDEHREKITRYLTMVDNKSSAIDSSYGVSVGFDENQNNKKVYNFGIASDILTSTMSFEIIGREYGLTDGLCELIFLKEPVTYSQNDLDAYAEMLQRSHVYYRNFDNKGQIKGTNSAKYRKIIKPIADRQKKEKQQQHTGDGLNLMQLPKQNIDYIYWDDPNELVDRLRLLISSTQAGHNSHNNEIVSIVQELREAEIIL